MEHLINIKTFARQPPEMVIFVPPKFPAPPSCSEMLKRSSGLAKEFRKSLTPHIYTACATQTTVLLVFFQGIFIFLLLLLDITIQDSFITLDCWNSSTRGGLISHQQALAWSSTTLDLRRPLQVTSTILITIFLLESLLRIAASGRRIIHHYWEMVDALIVLICFALNISALVNFTIGKQVAQFIILFRLWRTLELFSGTSFSSQPVDQYSSDRNNNSHLSASTTVMCDPSNYSAEQSVATLMLRIEELEQQITRLQEIPPCQRCVNHNWTTDDLLKLACMQLSRSDSRHREDCLRSAKSMEDLTLMAPESGYSSTHRKLPGGYPALIYRVSDRSQQRPQQSVVDVEAILLQLAGSGGVEDVRPSELSEIKRIAQIEFRPDAKLNDIPVTSL
ncbi:hypothetical protein BV898_03613 [Hypsibius exemplaris]|uniref:Voltage-gated hydrogen channel 1 n=1 Tax=Hypsibius exemplaris TaxID=2072580 RepID=A0A1W0X553_HYPEX|nr:hypothetical protein BV898_03613 [Hypsibius exemplaris]